MSVGKDPSQFFKAFLFPNIFRAFRMAIHPRKMVIAYLGVLLVTLAGLALDITETVVADSTQRTELDRYVQSKAAYESFIQIHGDEGVRTGVFLTLVKFGVDRFEAILGALKHLGVESIFVVIDNLAEGFKAIEWAFRYHLLYSILFFAIMLAVSAVTGGAICRMAALEFAQEERPGLLESLRYGLQRFGSFYGAPLTPVAIVAGFGSFIFVLGLLGNIKYVGEILVGLSMPLILIAGVLMMLVILGTLGGLNLMFPTIAFENSQCFLAVNNSFRYVFSRPWRLGFYSGVALVYGAISYAMTRFFVFGLLLSAYRFLELGFLENNAKLLRLWQEPRFESLYTLTLPSSQTVTESIGAILIQISVLTVIGLLVAYVVSFCFSANTIIYALMRKRVDNIELTEVKSIYEDDEDDED
ncbi:MAG: hypothetical protein HQ515_21250 [Phycisphaeraceae bacterium]|nr:hypothetical protein [Phycisphaeraceae bacterium]